MRLKQAEQNEHLQLAMDCAVMGIWSYDPAEGIVVADERMHRIFGSLTLEGAIENWLERIHPEDRTRVEEHLAGALAEKHLYDLEYRILRDDGVRWIRSKGRLLWAEDQIDRMFGIVEDITERKLTEEALRITQERVRLAQEAGNIATFDWDLTTGRVEWQGSARIYGRPPEEVAHIDDIFPFIHEQDRDPVAQSIQPAMFGKGEFYSEFRVCWPDNSVHWIVGQGIGMVSPDGKPLRIVGVNFDVTDRKRAEAALLQSEKLAAVGRLASTIAHEINNPLESITNLLYLARTTSDTGEIREYLETAERELRRASAITTQTLRFHRQTSNPQPVTCGDLFQEVLSIYQSRIVNRSIHIEKRKRAHRSVLCFEGEIRQVLSNLIGNAVDAMPTGGRLLVRSRHGTNWRTGSKGLVLTVADTGLGMSPLTLQKIFEAFFSTKGAGGTGLGLWVSKEIIDKHSGKLQVRSSQVEQHRGTVFALFLPFDAVKR